MAGNGAVATAVATEGNRGARLVFVVEQRYAVPMYLDAVRGVADELVTVTAVAELFPLMIRERFNGILLDVPTLVRASASEKALLHDLLQIFPTVRLKWDSRTMSVQALFYGQARKKGDDLAGFVREECVPFAARTIRLNERVPLHLNIMVAAAPAFSSHDAIRTATMNVSPGGCFIIGAEGWRRGDRFWMTAMELSDPTPIAVEVRWCKEWGRSLGIPGAGVWFREIAAGQNEELSRLCELHRFGT